MWGPHIARLAGARGTHMDPPISQVHVDPTGNVEPNRARRGSVSQGAYSPDPRGSEWSFSNPGVQGASPSMGQLEALVWG